MRIGREKEPKRNNTSEHAQQKKREATQRVIALRKGQMLAQTSRISTRQRRCWRAQHQQRCQMQKGWRAKPVCAMHACEELGAPMVRRDGQLWAVEEDAEQHQETPTSTLSANQWQL